MRFILHLYLKMPTIVGFLTFINRISSTSENFKARKIFIFQHFSFLRAVEMFMLSSLEHEKSWNLKWLLTGDSQAVLALASFMFLSQEQSSFTIYHLRFYTKIDYKRITLWQTVNTGLSPEVFVLIHKDKINLNSLE